MVVVVVVIGEAGGRTAQKCTALLGHETKATTLIWNYCLGSTAAAFLLLGIFFGLIETSAAALCGTTCIQLG